MSPLFWQCLLAAEISPARSQAIIDSFRGTRYDPIAFLRTHPDLNQTEQERVQETDLERFEKALQLGIQPLDETFFPDTMLQAPGHPVALFAWGDPLVLHTPCIVIVGTRRASSYGRAVAMKFAERFARAGVTVVSGGAIGIDAAAHEGALMASGRTLAVLGIGVDRVSSSQNKNLFKRIRENGCLLSQFAVGAESRDYHFLERNQVMAMLGLAVLVVEAPLGSGSLTTAKAAAELGRPVFVVPATIDRDHFRGSHLLIRDGATLVDHPDQILQELRFEPEKSRASSLKQQPMPKLQASILKCLEVDPLPLDKLSEQLKLEPSELLAELTVMELDGHILRDGIGYAKRL